MTNRHGLRRITASDAEIAAALEVASIPALMLSVAQLTGDLALLDGPVRPRRPGMLETQGHLDEAEKAAVRRQALRAICRFRDDGCKPAALPSEADIDRMLAFLVGEDELPSDYATLLREELALDGRDARRIEVPADDSADDFQVVIVGAGMSGLLLAIRLREAGIRFTILEKNSGVGGTWFENHYPGCRVDIASHNYSYSFDSGEWRNWFGLHGELRDYFARIARDHDVENSIVFGATVSDARFDEDSLRWRVGYERDGEFEVVEADVLISAVGQLNRPKIPDLPGRESFRGPQFHTAEWDESVDLAGLRVAVVGTGASAFQLVPELAEQAAHLCVFQRTPQWMFPNPNYHAEVSPEQQWCFRHLPGYARWYRVLSLWPMLDKAHPRLVVDPDWDDGGLSCGPANKQMRDELSGYIASQVRDPELLAKVLPQYPPFGTRTLQDNGSWLAALQRDDVSLVPERVERVTETGVIAGDGSEHDVDVIVWATGFHADRFLWPMELTGRGGARLSEEWRGAPSAYLGIALPKFPNLFCLYGPNTNVAHTANVIFVSECQATWIMQAIKQLRSEPLATLECTPEASAAYEKRLSDELEKLVWSHPNVHSFYRNAAGRVVVNMPWKAVDYWRWTRDFSLDDFVCTPRRAAAPE